MGCRPLTKKEVEIQTALGTLSYKKWMEFYGVLYRKKYIDGYYMWYFPVIMPFGPPHPRMSSLLEYPGIYYIISNDTIERVYKTEKCKIHDEKAIALSIIDTIYYYVVKHDHPPLKCVYDND